MRPSQFFHANAKRWLVICLGTILIVFRSSATFAQTIPLLYGQAYSAARSIFSLPVAVGDREGFFRREGLNFTVIIPIPGGSDKMGEAGTIKGPLPPTERFVDLQYLRVAGIK